MDQVLALQKENNSIDEMAYYLSSLVPKDIVPNLTCYFSEFMLTKLKIAELLKFLDLNKMESEKESLVNPYKEIEGFVDQFSREIKPALMKKFFEIEQYAHHFELYYPYFKEEMQQCQQSTVDASTGGDGYRAVIKAIFNHIPDNQEENDENITLYKLQFLIKELQQRYDTLYSHTHRLFINHLDENLLTSIEGDFQYVNAQLERMAEHLLNGALNSGDPIRLNISSAQAIASDANSLQTKKQQYYIRQYEENLQPLKMIAESNKNLFLLTLTIKSCLERLTHLADTVKKIDNFWKDSKKNLEALKKFIQDNKDNKTAQDFVLRYIEAARFDFEFLQSETNYLIANTSIGVPAGGNVNYLKLAFLLKEPMKTIA